MTRALCLIAPFTLLVALQLGCGANDEGQEPGDCEDGADNDGDGDFDCRDDGCEGAPVCVGVLDDDTGATDDGDCEVAPRSPELASCVSTGTYDSGRTVTDRYDGQGRLSEWTYDGVDGPSGTTYTRNSLGYITSVDSFAPDPYDPLFNYHYEYSYQPECELIGSVLDEGNDGVVDLEGTHEWRDGNLVRQVFTSATDPSRNRTYDHEFENGVRTETVISDGGDHLGRIAYSSEQSGGLELQVAEEYDSGGSLIETRRTWRDSQQRVVRATRNDGSGVLERNEETEYINGGPNRVVRLDYDGDGEWDSVETLTHDTSGRLIHRVSDYGTFTLETYYSWVCP